MSSIVWSTIAFLLVLLPGILFFSGIYAPEKFTRDVAPQSALGQLAGSVLVSLLVHGGLFFVVQALCELRFPKLLEPIQPPCIDLGLVFVVFQLQGASESISVLELGQRIEGSSGWILGQVQLFL